ncbi:MAG: hypothetical protein E7615_05415 [Ruminococcaceae bacterium]|nr:hypothetical protein [Oscillospiraceae bacterium]
MGAKKVIKSIIPKAMWNWMVDLKITCGIANTFRKVKKSLPDYKNDKIKILFIVQRTEVFTSVRTVFEEAIKDERCEVYILPLPKCINTERGQELLPDTLDEVIDFCAGLKGAELIDSYDKDTKRFYDLNELKPDYIFLNVPYTTQYPSDYSMEKLVKIGKVCFVPYSYTFGDTKKYNSVYQTEFHTTLLSHASYLFMDGEASYKFCKKKLWLSEFINGKKLFNLGYPRFDRVISGNKNHEKLTALWIPRWTTKKQDGFISSSFFDFKDEIIRYFKSRVGQLELITRPHPIAFDNYIKDGFMTKESVELYKKEYVGNLHLDETKDYIGAFVNSDVMIADFSGMIIEYFMMNKPIIYCGEKDDFVPELKYITDTFYYASSWQEVEGYIELLQNGMDEKKDLRNAAVEKFKNEAFCSSERILDRLIKDYYSKK